MGFVRPDLSATAARERFLLPRALLHQFLDKDALLGQHAGRHLLGQRRLLHGLANRLQCQFRLLHASARLLQQRDLDGGVGAGVVADVIAHLNLRGLVG